MAKVEIYTSQFCGYCIRAKELLLKKGVAYEEIDVGMDDAKREAMTKRAGGRTTVPQIFINGQHVGGCDAVYALNAQGKLAPMLADG